MSLPVPAPNHALEPTPNSLRSCVAPAIGRGSPPALGARPANGGEVMSYGLTRVHSTCSCFATQVVQRIFKRVAK